MTRKKIFKLATKDFYNGKIPKKISEENLFCIKKNLEDRAYKETLIKANFDEICERKKTKAL